MKASVVTPNYNGKEFLKTYFDSLNRNKDFVGEVILVDNGSTDESIEFIKDYSSNLDFPVIIIRNAENLGFAKAVNQGILKSSYPYIFSLNNDTQVEESGIKPLIDLISSDDGIFSVASKMVQFDNKKLIDDAGDEYNILAWTKKTGENQPAENYDEVYEIFSSCAGAAMYNKAILEKIGLFDENFFAYMEDVDLNAIGYRIQQQRNNLRLTQQYMCDKLDITQNHYSRIENGHVGMSFNILLQLSQILKISTDYILTGNIENIDELYFDVNYNNLTSKQKEYINRQIQLLAEFDLK